VVIISEALRRAHRPNEGPGGEGGRFSWGAGGVGGVVGGGGGGGPDGPDRPPAGVMYPPLGPLPMRRRQGGGRPRADPDALIAPLRGAVAALDPGVAMFDVRTMDRIVSVSTAAQRTLLLLIGGFAAIALILAAMGVYGTIALVVVQRTREIGLRLAVGAQRGDILRLVL